MENSLVQGIIGFLTAGGTTGVAFVTARGFWRWWTGRAGRERMRTRSIADEKDAALNLLDDEATYRRAVQEWASKLVRIIHEAGLGHLIPEEPQNPADERQKRPPLESRQSARRRREGR